MNNIKVNIYPSMDADYVGSTLCSTMDKLAEDDWNVIAIGTQKGTDIDEMVNFIRNLLQMDMFSNYKVAIRIGNISDDSDTIE